MNTYPVAFQTTTLTGRFAPLAAKTLKETIREKVHVRRQKAHKEVE